MKKHIYFTVGPTQLYPTVERHITTAIQEEILSLNHRSSAFEHLYFSAVEKLRQVFKLPKATRVFFTGSGLESMERTIQNCAVEKSFHIVHGEFSKKFYQFALDYQKKPEKVEVVPTKGFAKKLIISQDTELIALTHNETSTGSMMLMDDIADIHKKVPGAIIAIDMVSSAPCVPLDFALIDVAFFSVQKGFGLPAGLGVLLVSERAMQKAWQVKEKGKSIGSYHNFLSLDEKAKVGQTPETPNVLEIYLLNKVAEQMLAYGIDQIQKETAEKAQMLYDFFDHHSIYQPLVKEKDIRSLTTLVIDVKGTSSELRKKLGEKGILLSNGYGPYKNEHVRIANFPSQTRADIEMLIDFLKINSFEG